MRAPPIPRKGGRVSVFFGMPARGSPGQTGHANRGGLVDSLTIGRHLSGYLSPADYEQAHHDALAAMTLNGAGLTPESVAQVPSECSP